MEDIVQSTIDFFGYYANNFQRNLIHGFDSLDLVSWIRLIAVLGAYILLRPYLEKAIIKKQTTEHEKELDPDEVAKISKAKISPNNLRGLTEPEEDSDDEKADVPEPNWGKKARKRQRQIERKIMEAEEKIRKEQDENDDVQDIRDLLVDYEEGVDGW
jgi:hypothetical protein